MPLKSPTTESQTRHRNLMRLVAAFGVIASALGSIAFLGAWIFVRVRGPVESSARDGSTVRMWIADEGGIARGLIREPSGGVPAVPVPAYSAQEPGRGYTTRAAWPTRNQEWFWFRVTERTERHFVPPLPSKNGVFDVNDERFRKSPGIDVNATWVCFYPGRVAATLATPLIAWVLFVVCRRVRRALDGASRVRPYDRYCPRCTYDLRATPDRCPECGWVAPPPVDSEKFATALSEVR
jgi:hypothetical protein